jgi:hypothetical protein
MIISFISEILGVMFGDKESSLEENESLRLLNSLTIRDEFAFSLAEIKSIKGLKNDFVIRFGKI